LRDASSAGETRRADRLPVLFGSRIVLTLARRPQRFLGLSPCAMPSVPDSATSETSHAWHSRNDGAFLIAISHGLDEARAIISSAVFLRNTFRPKWCSDQIGSTE
jgi:hypothetical protein